MSTTGDRDELIANACPCGTEPAELAWPEKSPALPGMPAGLAGWTLAEIGDLIRGYDDRLLLHRATLPVAQGTAWGVLLNAEITRRAFDGWTR